MTAMLSGLISLATAICNLIATDELLQYPTQLANLQNELNAEIAKGFNSDDAKIESLYQQIDVIRGEIQNVLAVLQAGKGQSVAASSPSGSSVASS